MNAVLPGLESLVGKISEFNLENKQWDISNKIANKGKEFFSPLVRAHAVITIEYNVICSNLLSEFGFQDSDKYTPADKELLTKELIAALIMAEILTHLYEHYLLVPREVKRLKADQRILQALLQKRGYIFKPLTFPINENKPLDSQKIRTKTSEFNVWRLLPLRAKRVILTILPFFSRENRLAVYINAADKYFLKHIFNFLSFAYFIPRLITNYFLIAKHLIPGFWMTDAERQVNWFIRLQAQLQRRWFEIANDTVWATAGVLTCFFLVGSLAAAGTYLTVGLFLFDIFLACLRAYIELSRLNDLKIFYEKKSLQLQSDPNLDINELAQIKKLQKHLDLRIKYEQKRLFLSIVNMTALFVGVFFTIPIFAVSPFIPLMSAIFVLMITLAAFIASKQLEKMKPADKIEDIEEKGNAIFNSQYVMFPPPAAQDSTLKLNGRLCHSASDIEVEKDKIEPIKTL